MPTPPRSSASWGGRRRSPISTRSSPRPGAGSRSTPAATVPDAQPCRTLGGSGLAGCRSEEHTSELQSHVNLVCRLLLEKKKKHIQQNIQRCLNVAPLTKAHTPSAHHKFATAHYTRALHSVRHEGHH